MVRFCTSGREARRCKLKDDSDSRLRCLIVRQSRIKTPRANGAQNFFDERLYALHDFNVGELSRTIDKRIEYNFPALQRLRRSWHGDQRKRNR